MLRPVLYRTFSDESLVDKATFTQDSLELSQDPRNQFQDNTALEPIERPVLNRTFSDECLVEDDTNFHMLSNTALSSTTISSGKCKVNLRQLLDLSKSADPFHFSSDHHALLTPNFCKLTTDQTSSAAPASNGKAPQKVTGNKGLKAKDFVIKRKAGKIPKRTASKKKWELDKTSPKDMLKMYINSSLVNSDEKLKTKGSWEIPCLDPMEKSDSTHGNLKSKKRKLFNCSSWMANNNNFVLQNLNQ